MAYEAIDRHAESDQKNKVALHYQDAERKNLIRLRHEKFD